MKEQKYQLAQMSIAQGKYSMDHPHMQTFVSQLDRINSLADRSPGFVWRLQTEDGDATGLRGYDNPLIFLNLSVWNTIKELREFVFKSDHSVPYRNSKEWYIPMKRPVTALWWVKEGHRPTVEEGVARLEAINNIGASRYAFGFRGAYEAPKAGDELSLVERGLKEVVELHDYFQQWLSGQLDANEECGKRLKSSFDSEAILITPNGVVESFYSIEMRFRAAHAMNPGVEIWTTDYVPLKLYDDGILVKYKEWRHLNGETSGRITTCQFKFDDDAPNGLKWSHIHETWLDGKAPATR